MRTLTAPQARRHHATARGGGECLSQGSIPHVLDVALVGDDHVGLGSDFDGIFEVPRDGPDCSAYPSIPARLGRAGLGEPAVRKVAWGNFLRVLRANDA